MIRLQDISLFFGERVLFDHLSFTITAGEKLAICGRNGSGKSTLFKLILKEIRADEGIVEIQGQQTIGFLRQELPPDKELTVIEDLRQSVSEIQSLQDELTELHNSLHDPQIQEQKIIDVLHRIDDIEIRLRFLDADKLEGKIEKILTGLGFNETDLNKMVSSFSGGWRMRIELAKLLLKKPDILLLDEPNNHLDIVSLQWLEKFLQDYEGTVLLISHDLMFLDRIAKRVIELDRGRVYDYKGNYTAYKIYKEERKIIETNEFNAQQRIIQHKEQLIEKFRYKASKASFAQSLITELDRLQRKELPEEDMSSIKLRFKTSQPSGRKVLEAEHITKKYDEKLVLKEINLLIERGAKISFIGANGNGKTTMVRMICGLTEQSEGKIELGHNVHLGYYAQEHGELIKENKTALENVEDASIPEMRSMVRKVLGGLGFSGEDVEKKISVLSGGEKARIRLAKLIVNEHNLLILDEPTHHLDIPSKERLKESLLNYNGTIIIVSHDRDFLKGLADRTILFANQSIQIFEGDIEYYLEKTEETNIYNAKRPVVENKSASSQSATISSSEKKKFQRQAQNLEKEILKLEAQINELDLKLSAPSFYQSKEYEESISKYSKVKERIAAATLEWEDVISQLE
jgi:ATP-binding cassette subfamily F protein 3